MAAVLATGPLSFAQSDWSDDGSYVMDFQGRKVDITPFYDSFPYSQFSMSKDGSKLFFHKDGDRTQLQWMELNGSADFANAEDAIEADLSKCNVWNNVYNAKDSCIYWIGDDNNDEVVNLYRSNLYRPMKQKLTDVPYIYEWGFNPDRTKIAYVSRMGQSENRLDELHIIDLNTLKDTLVNTDQPDFRYTWGDISWRPDDSGLMLIALKDMDRHYASVLYIDLHDGSRKVLTDSSRQASYDGTAVMEDWLDSDRCCFFSDQDGFRNLYSFNAKSGEVRQMTFFKTDLADARYLTVGGKKCLFGMQSDPIHTTFMLLDCQDGKVLFSQNSDKAYSIGSAVGDEVRLIATGVSTVFEVDKVKVGKKSMQTSLLLELPASLRSQLVTGSVKRLSIPTFDMDPATGKQRLLHAYLFCPLNPLPAGKAMVMLESFYGGDNRYQSEYEIYNSAGIYVLSASPRGSSGFGRDFAALNDGDLGGNEEIDMIRCAKFISDSLGIPASRVGCFGVSHGGYATMRLMTFPGEVNGNRDSFPFGFGIETSGFCDIIYQYYHSNIPDWITLEAGDVVKDKARIVDRSPLYHADLITGPILLVHGNHDNRVEIEGSRQFDRALTQLGKPHRYIEFEGLGHGVKGKENERRFFKEAFRFLDEVEDELK